MSQHQRTMKRNTSPATTLSCVVICAILLCSFLDVSALIPIVESGGRMRGRTEDVSSTRRRQGAPSWLLKLGNAASDHESPTTQFNNFLDHKIQEESLNNESVEWEVYVDQSKSSLERGGSATLDAFVGLAPPEVRVSPAILPKSKAKGPVVVCVSLQDENESLEIANVDSVDKVYRILIKHMRVQGVDASARECLKWKYKGNGHLEEGEASLAIAAYDKALATRFSEQEGIILLMRATAYLQRASSHQEKLRELVADLSQSVPDTANLQHLYEEAERHPSLSTAIFQRVIADTKNSEFMFRKTKFRHGLYQYALLHAAQDSLRATQLLSNYSNSWIRAGEILSELWKLKESAKYYEKAIEIDPSLSSSLSIVIERLRKRQELLDSARAYGIAAEDTLRLALDVAG